jgi:cobalamin biosynthesis protein CobW
MPARIPATVVTGFLGAGKTSLIRHLAEHAGGRRLAFLINEFGDQGVDREVLTGCGIAGCGDDEVVELANGCICCTVADDFLPAMRTILARDPRPEHILIETSGLALPKPLVQAFNWPDVRSMLTVDGVVAVVDAEAVAAGRFAAAPEALQRLREADDAIDHETPLEELFEEQVACADLVLVNKADRVGAGARAEVEAAVRRDARPGVQLVWIERGRIDPQVALGLAVGAEDDLEGRRSHHDDGEPHDHDDFASFVMELPAVTDPATFAARLEGVIRRFDLLRVKGFLAIDGKGMRHVVQAVGPRIERWYDKPWAAGETRRSALVVIAERDKLDDADAVRRALVEAVPA